MNNFLLNTNRKKYIEDKHIDKYVEYRGNRILYRFQFFDSVKFGLSWCRWWIYDNQLSTRGILALRGEVKGAVCGGLFKGNLAVFTQENPRLSRYLKISCQQNLVS